MSKLGARMIQVPAILLLLITLYFLSYAPVLKIISMCDENQHYRVDLFNGMECYEPVLWCIWKTPLQTPMLAWAKLLGVETQVELNAFFYVQYQLHGEYPQL